MATRFQPKCRPGLAAAIWLDEAGYFKITVAGADGFRRNFGLNRELPDSARMIEVSRPWVDWQQLENMELLTRLVRLERSRYDTETQAVLAQIVA